MEESQSTASGSPPAIRSTIAYYAIFIALGMIASVLGPTLPRLAEHTRTNLAEIGFLFTGSSFGYMVGSLGIGNLIDRLRGHRLLPLTIFIMAAMVSLIPLVDVLWLLTGVIFILGIVQGGTDVSINLLLVWLHGKRANPFLNGLHFFFGVGAFIAPLIVARVLLSTGEIYWAYWILALYPLPFALWLARLPSPQSPHITQKVEGRSVNWLLVILIALVFFFYVGAEGGYGGWIYTYAIQLNLANAAGAALLTSLYWGALTAGRLLGVALATRLRPPVILVGDLVGSLISLGIIWIFPQNPIVVWSGTAIFGVCMASVFPTLLAYADQHLTMTGQITRWFFVGTGLGGMVLPWILGLLMVKVGPTSIITAIWISIALALISFWGSEAAARRPVRQESEALP